MSIQNVLNDRQPWHIKSGDCLALMSSMPERSVDLVFGSPPYAEKGDRYIGGRKKWKTDDWIDWMLDVTSAAQRISKGYVLWVVNGSVRHRRYLPACEGLIWQAHRRGIICERPCIWHKNAPPNRKDWFANAWEYVIAFRPNLARSPYFDWQPVAQPPKYHSGGRFRQRGANGKRRLGSEYPQGKLARPKDVVRVTVGGGHLGSPLAHENEAPMPEKLAAYFVLSCCPPGGVVLDPFSGSATTGAVAIKTGRRYVGLDLRASQVALGKLRLTECRPEQFWSQGRLTH